MKKLLLKSLLAAFIFTGLACDQNRSGPVDAVATPSEEEGAPVAPKSASVLFETRGPATSVPAGTATDVEFVVTPTTGFKINQRFEWNFEFHPSDAVEIGTPKVSMEQVKLDDSQAIIPLKITAKKGGEHTLTATGNFSICNDDKCELYRDREVSFTMAATDG